MSFQSTMLLGVVLLGVALLVVMLHFTTPPFFTEINILSRTNTLAYLTSLSALKQ